MSALQPTLAPAGSHGADAAATFSRKAAEVSRPTISMEGLRLRGSGESGAIRKRFLRHLARHQEVDLPLNLGNRDGSEVRFSQLLVELRQLSLLELVPLRDTGLRLLA